MKKILKRLKMFWKLSSRLINKDYYIINCWKRGEGWTISHYFLPEGEPERALRLIDKAYKAITIFMSKLIIDKRLKTRRN